MSQPAYLFIGGPLDGNWEAVPGEPRYYTVPMRTGRCTVAEVREEPAPSAPGVLSHTYRLMRVVGAPFAFYVSADLSVVDWLAALVTWYKKEPKRAAKW